MKVSEGQTLIDLCLKLSGSIEALFVFSGANGAAIDQELQVGQEIKAVSFQAPADQLPVYLKPDTEIINQVTCTEGQSLFDLVLQETGALEATAGLLAINDLSWESFLQAGQSIKVTEDLVANKALRNYFRQNKIRINTGLIKGLLNPNIWVDENNDPILDFNNDFIEVE